MSLFANKDTQVKSGGMVNLMPPSEGVEEQAFTQEAPFTEPPCAPTDTQTSTDKYRQL